MTSSSPAEPYFPFTRTKTFTLSSSPSSPLSFTGPDSPPLLPADGLEDEGFAREASVAVERAAGAGLITGAILGATIVLIGICVFLCFNKWKKKKKMKKQRDLEEATINGVSKLDDSNLHQWKQIPNSDNANNLFTYEDLAKATDNFSKTNLIGQGGFGYVHRGVLSDGRVVAVKQLKSESRQGEREFQAVIQIISRVHHRHLVSLLGYCITGSQRLLVYDFVPNKTREFHLHEKGRLVLEWPKRMKIALGAAKGLAYLHEDCRPKTIHRDVKAANILIDDSFAAKVFIYIVNLL